MSTSLLSFEHARLGRWVFAAVCWGAVVTPAIPASILQFDQWMQAVDRRSQDMQRSLARGDSASALLDAREVGELYRLMQDYFTQRGDAVEAVKLSGEGAAAADEVLQSIRGNKLDTASAVANSIVRGCRDCHVKFKPLDP